ncbi:MAG: TetR/AcrR family transcriptional regulator [Bacilli bacterium]|nr:TetR/AcrR family transcriptional regulator [Bacilli bacterium]
MKDTSKTSKEFEKVLFALLEKKNYHDITINEICALTNKTKMTFYSYFKDKDDLLSKASINLINYEYNEAYEKIINKETSSEEIEYLSILETYEWVARHYNQIQNLIYKGETLPFEIFKKALYINYSKFIAYAISSSGIDIPSDYLSVFCFEGIFGSCLYYAEQLKNNKNKKKTKESIKKICRLLAKLVMVVEKGEENS